MMGAFGGPHTHYETCTVINYVGGFVPPGLGDPIQDQMDAFMKEEVDFDMPENSGGWS